MMYRGSPSWYVFAVESQLDKVTEAFTKLRKTARVHRDIPVTPADGDENVGVLVPVAELVGSSWVVVVRAKCILTSQIIKEFSEDAKMLSKSLKTRAVSFLAERHSGSAGYELYDKGELVDRAIWADTSEFISKQADRVFSGLGVYFPVCVGRDEDEPSLSVDK